MSFGSKSIMGSIWTTDLPGLSPLDTTDMYPLHPGQDSETILVSKHKACHSVSKSRSLGCNKVTIISLIFLNISLERPDSSGISYCKIGIPFHCTTSDAFFNFCRGIGGNDGSFLASFSLRGVLDTATPILRRTLLPSPDHWLKESYITLFIISLTLLFTAADCLYLVTSSKSKSTKFSKLPPRTKHVIHFYIHSN